VARRRSPRTKSGFIESERTTTSDLLLRKIRTKIIQISAEETTLLATETHTVAEEKLGGIAEDQ
jgi:hypothetical protein